MPILSIFLSCVWFFGVCTWCRQRVRPNRFHAHNKKQTVAKKIPLSVWYSGKHIIHTNVIEIWMDTNLLSHKKYIFKVRIWVSSRENRTHFHSVFISLCVDFFSKISVYDPGNGRNFNSTEHFKLHHCLLLANLKNKSWSWEQCNFRSFSLTLHTNWHDIQPKQMNRLRDWAEEI